MAETQSNFSDGAGYERFMGRWSRLVGQQFLAWIVAPKANPGLMWVAEMGHSPKKYITTQRHRL